jgi:integrase
MPTIEKRVSPLTKAITYRAKVRVKGYPTQQATFERKSDALQWGQKTEVEIRTHKYLPENIQKHRTTQELIDKYLAHLAKINPRRHKEVRQMLLWWKQEIGAYSLSTLTTEHILTARERLFAKQSARKDKDGKPRTLSHARINRYDVALRTAFTYAVKKLKWLHTHPMSDIELLEEPTECIRFLTAEQVKQLLDACKTSRNASLHSIVLMGITTGARKSEIRNMRWEHVSPDFTAITLPKTKNKNPRSVPIPDKIAAMLQRMKAENPDSVFLFPSPHNAEQSVDFDSAWKTARKEAKLEDFRFHDLRHTCASHMAMNGGSLVAIAEILGHKTLQMVKRYAHIAPQHNLALANTVAGKVLGNVEI